MAKEKTAKRTTTTKGSLWKELLCRRPVVLIGIAIAFTSTAAFVWDEVIVPWLRLSAERPKLLNVFLFLHWYWWTIGLLILMVALIQHHAHKLIHAAEEDRNAAQTKARETPPNISAKSYGPLPGQEGFGLIVANPGYAARNVHIPDVPIGSTNYELSFPLWMGQLCIHDQNQLFRAWIKQPEQTIDGLLLFNVMVENNVEGIPLAIKYQDDKDK